VTGKLRPAEAMDELARAHPWIVGITATYILAFAVRGALIHDTRTFSYVLVVSTLAVAVAVVDRSVQWTGRELSRLSAVGLVHLVGGILQSPANPRAIFYNTWVLRPILKFDQLAHGLGYAVCTAASFRLVEKWVDRRRCTPAGMAMMAAMMAVSIGAVNETFEFVATQNLPGGQAGGYLNTEWDLLFNLAGAVGMAIWLTLTYVSSDEPTHASVQLRYHQRATRV
jgi:hypothetical protein